MKKSPKSKSPAVPVQVESELTGLINKIQQQLVFLEKKIDTLILRTPEKSYEVREQPKPLQPQQQPNQSAQPRPQGEMKQNNMRRERVMYKAICADCKKECEVPFKPSQDRPVYCKDCFSKRKSSGSFKPNNNGPRPAPARPAPEGPVQKLQKIMDQVPVEKPVENKKPAAKKKTAVKKPVARKKKKSS